MNIEKVGVILELNKDDFIHKGFGYIKDKVKISENKEVSIGFSPDSMLNFNFAFQQKIEELCQQFRKENQNETLKKENEEINENIFTKYKGYLLDLVLLPDTGFKGIDKINIANNSIVYFQIKPNLSMGFLVHKELAYLLFGGE